MAAPEVTELNTPLYQRVGENLYQLHVQTTAAQPLEEADPAGR